MTDCSLSSFCFDEKTTKSQRQPGSWKGAESADSRDQSIDTRSARVSELFAPGDATTSNVFDDGSFEHNKLPNFIIFLRGGFSISTHAVKCVVEEDLNDDRSEPGTTELANSMDVSVA